MVKKIIGLKHAVFFHHLKIFVTNKRFQNSCCDVGMVVAAQRVANIMYQRTDDILIILAITVPPACLLWAASLTLLTLDP